jgi:hypothetical protein
MMMGGPIDPVTKKTMKAEAAFMATLGVVCIGLIRIAPVALETLGLASE